MAYPYDSSYQRPQRTNLYPHNDYDQLQPSLPFERQREASPYGFHESSYFYDRATPAPSYTSDAGQGRIEYERDPFEDAASIPLNERKHASTATLAPILPQEQDDPFVRDVDPTRSAKSSRREPRPKNGWFTGKITWVVFVLTTIQIAVFIAEIVKNAVLTGSPIEIHPSFNPMIGPSPYVMINMGSRFDPCMHNVTGLDDLSASDDNILWPCPNATSVTAGSAGATCSLHELCGFGAKTDVPAPNQWWRFIIPMFIHAGIVHIGFNLLLQLTLGRDIERLIGSVRFALVYFASGIFGFVLGGNFAADGISSCGCSGSLFGILAITLLDLLYTWRTRPSPWRDLAFIGLDVAIAFVLGLLPGLDNFAHIGGFLMGLTLGVCVLRSPSAIARRTDELATDDPTTGGTSARERRRRARSSHNPATSSFDPRAPLAAFRARRPAWWAWWALRAAALLGALVALILLLKNFYVWGVTCSWCKYLSCLPITVDGTNWCKEGTLDFSSSSSSSSDTSSRRDLLALAESMAARRVWR